MADIYDMIREVTTALGETSSVQRDILKKQQGISNENVSLAETAMPAALEVLGQKAQGDLDAQNAGIAVRNQLGNNPEDPNSLLAILTQDFRENTLIAREQAAGIAARKQVTLFDDLPQFLINQIMLPDEINAYNGTMGKVKVAQEGISAMQSLTTASAQAAKATAQTLTKESIKNQAIVDSAQLAQKINVLKHDSLGYDMEALKLTNHQNAQTLQWAMNEHSMRMQDANFALSQAEHQLRLKKLKEADIEDQQYVDFVNAGAGSYELPKVNLDTIKLMMKSPEQKAKLDRLFNRGIELAATGSNSVGATPGEAIMGAMEVGGLKGEQNKPARDYLARIYSDVVSSYPPNTKVTPALKMEIQTKINDVLYGPIDPKSGKRNEAKGELYKMALDVERPGSLFKAPDLPALVGVPSIKSNPIFESVIAPAVAAGITKSDPATMYAQGLEAVKRGLINDKQLALGLADFYKATSAVTYASSGAGKFGLPYRPGYMSKLEDPVGFGSLQQDWAKEENWIMYHTMSQAAKGFFGALGSGMTTGVR